MTPPEAIAIGETMVLLYPRDLATPLSGIRELMVDVAGADSNFAIAMARLGWKSGWISRVGADPLGQLVTNTVRHEGVDVSQVVVDKERPTGLYVKYHDAQGEPRVIYYRRGSAASALTARDIKPEYFAEVKLLQLSGMTAALSRACEEAMHRAIELAHRRHARICLDLNLRLQLWSLSAARQALSPLLSMLWVLSGTEEEYLQFFGKSRLVDALMEAHGRGPETVVATRGVRGALALVKGRIVSHPGYAPPRVVDPVGAGDGFNAGFVASLLRGLPPEEALRIANRIGAAAVTTPGDFHGYPSWAELEEDVQWPERERDGVDLA